MQQRPPKDPGDPLNHLGCIGTKNPRPLHPCTRRKLMGLHSSRLSHRDHIPMHHSSPALTFLPSHLTIPCAGEYQSLPPPRTKAFTRLARRERLSDANAARGGSPCWTSNGTVAPATQRVQTLQFVSSCAGTENCEKQFAMRPRMSAPSLPHPNVQPAHASPLMK